MRYINLSTMTYEELLELEKRIQEAKVAAKDYLTKSSFNRPYYDPIVKLLIDRGIECEIFASSYVNSIESCVLKIADVTMGNYTPVSSNPTSQIRCNGSVITSDDNDLYEEMVNELNTIIAGYANKLVEKKKEAKND